jgi:sigma-B regulation protein RsbU (phosphoserine phosphatase)
VERLGVTAPVVGLFEEWECSACEVHLCAGDVVAIFSDGITEAMHGDEESGEARLTRHVQDHLDLAADQIVAGVLASVQEFSAGDQSDDLTLVVLRAIEGRVTELGQREGWGK